MCSGAGLLVADFFVSALRKNSVTHRPEFRLAERRDDRVNVSKRPARETVDNRQCAASTFYPYAGKGV